MQNRQYHKHSMHQLCYGDYKRDMQQLYLHSRLVIDSRIRIILTGHILLNTWLSMSEVNMDSEKVKHQNVQWLYVTRQHCQVIIVDQKNDLSGIKCFNCNKFGHYRSSCSKPDKRKNKNKNSSAAAAAIGDNEDSDEGESAQEGARQQANAARAVSSSQVTSGRTYCAVARLGVALVAAAAASSSKSTAVKQPLKRLVRPGESRRPPAAASSSSSSSAAVASPKIVEPRIASSKSLDHALRTTARAVDTGATVPLTPNKDSLINARKCMPMPILMADGTVASATYKGDMPMRLPVAGEQDKKVKIVIKDVYFHERFHMNLLSWDCMRKEGWTLTSGLKGTQLTTPKGTKINASTRGGLTILDDAGPERALIARMGRIVCQTASDLLMLHNRV